MSWDHLYAAFLLLTAALLFWQFIRNLQAGEVWFGMGTGKPPAIFARTTSPGIYWVVVSSSFIIALGMAVSGLQLMGVPILPLTR